jgi:hypothetical protein
MPFYLVAQGNSSARSMLLDCMSARFHIVLRAFVNVPSAHLEGLHYLSLS